MFSISMSLYGRWPPDFLCPYTNLLDTTSTTAYTHRLGVLESHRFCCLIALHLHDVFITSSSSSAMKWQYLVWRLKPWLCSTGSLKFWIVLELRHHSWFHTLLLNLLTCWLLFICLELKSLLLSVLQLWVLSDSTFSYVYMQVWYITFLCFCRPPLLSKNFKKHICHNSGTQPDMFLCPMTMVLQSFASLLCYISKPHNLVWNITNLVIHTVRDSCIVLV